MSYKRKGKMKQAFYSTPYPISGNYVLKEKDPENQEERVIMRFPQNSKEETRNHALFIRMLINGIHNRERELYIEWIPKEIDNES